ncbi:uncharacterized protein [Argopecten irradians]|uniref:uncharacterized protein n=1 Tax=Argopecten irradians TaxID=31199 RepID=UPI00371B3C33
MALFTLPSKPELPKKHSITSQLNVNKIKVLAITIWLGLILDIRMCEDGNVTSDRVILDTHEAEDTGEITCSCIVNSPLIILINIEFYGEGLNPNTSSCGSEVVVPKSGSVEEDIRYQCEVVIPNTTFTITCTKPFNSIPSPTTIPSTRATTVTSGGITLEPTKGDVETETTTPVSHSTSSTETHVYAVAILAICLCLVSLYAAAMTFLYVRRCVEKRSLRESDTRSEMPDEGGYENMSVPATVDRTYDGLELAEVDLNVNTYDELRN